MPRLRTPVELLQPSGTYRHHRHRGRLAAPKSGRPIGDPPPALAPDEAAAWCEFVHCAPAGVLTSADRWAVEAVARLMGKSRRQGLTSAERGTLLGFLRELGATPAARGRVSAVLPPAGG
jgi:hypothetical protein